MTEKLENANLFIKNNRKAIEAISENMPGGFLQFRMDEDLSIIYANSKVREIFACPDTKDFMQMTGGTFSGMVYPDDWDRVKNHLIETEQDSYVEFRIRRKDGVLRWLVAYGKVSQSEQMGPICQIFLSDGTERFRQREVAQGLSKGYNSVYLCNIKNGNVWPYITKNDVAISMREVVSAMQKYNEILIQFAMRYVVAEDREYFLQLSAIDHVLEELKNQEMYHFSFHRHTEDENKVECIQMVFSRTEMNPDILLFGLKPIQDEIFSVHYTMTRYFASIYNTTYYINLIDNTGYSVCDHDYNQEGFGSLQRDFLEEVYYNLEERVFSDEKERILDFVSRENLEKNLKNINDVIRTQYHDNWFGKLRMVELQVILLSKENKKNKNILMTMRYL